MSYRDSLPKVPRKVAKIMDANVKAFAEEVRKQVSGSPPDKRTATGAKIKHPATLEALEKLSTLLAQDDEYLAREIAKLAATIPAAELQGQILELLRKRKA